MSQPAVHRDVPPQQRYSRAEPPSPPMGCPPSSESPKRDPSFPALWARSVWSPGACVRCDRTDLEVTVIGLLPTVGGTVKICVCRACSFQIEQAHWATLLGGERDADAGTDDFAWWPQPRRAQAF